MPSNTLCSPVSRIRLSIGQLQSVWRRLSAIYCKPTPSALIWHGMCKHLNPTQTIQGNPGQVLNVLRHLRIFDINRSSLDEVHSWMILNLLKWNFALNPLKHLKSTHFFWTIAHRRDFHFSLSVVHSKEKIHSHPFVVRAPIYTNTQGTVADCQEAGEQSTNTH